MKTLLRALLFINALIALIAGLVLVATPWLSSYPALAGFASQPGLSGQLLGVMLLSMCATLIAAAVSGALTVAIARVSGHTIWIFNVVLLIWMIAFDTPPLLGKATWIAPLASVIVLILGLAQVRAAGAVRARERRLAAGAQSAARAENAARSQSWTENRARAPLEPTMVPTSSVTTTTTSTGEPLHPAGAYRDSTRDSVRPLSEREREPGFTSDPLTGRGRFDPIEPEIPPVADPRREVRDIHDVRDARDDDTGPPRI